MDGGLRFANPPYGLPSSPKLSFAWTRFSHRAVERNRSVARMERSAIRDLEVKATPDFASLHPGYARGQVNIPNDWALPLWLVTS
jgi:hypothetical protein